MKRKIIIIILSLFAFSTAKAQIDSATAALLIGAELTKIQYVFEGTIIDVKLYPGDEEGNELNPSSMIWNNLNGSYGFPNLSDGGSPYCYSIATIRVCQVYKGGEYVYDTMKILTRKRNVQISLVADSSGNMVPDYFWGIESRDNWIGEQFYKPGREGTTQIFFAFNHTYMGVSSLIKILSDIGQIDFRFYRYDPYSENEADWILAGTTGLIQKNHRYFYSRQEIYDFLEAIPLLYLDVHSPNICEAGSFKEKKNPKTQGEVADVKKDFKQNIKNYNNWLNWNSKKQTAIQRKTDTKLKKAGETLILEMANPRVTGPDYQPWLEFDILVSSNVNTTFFDNCAMHIKYDNAGSNKAFGTNIVANNNVQIIRFGSFNTSTYINPQTMAIDHNDTLVIPFGTDFFQNPLNRVQLTTTPQKMLTIRMKIAVKNKAAGISFMNIAMASNVSFFSDGADSINIFQYDNTQMNGSNNDKTAKPIITSFNTPVSAGTSEILTIEGKYFGGPASKNGTIFFKNANRGNVYPIASLKQGIDNFDIVKWSNDTIQIKIPYAVDSITTNPNDDDYRAVPGSGKFKIINRFGVMTESTTELKIPYSIIQYIASPPTEKSGINLAGIKNSGYTVYLNHSVVSAFPSGLARVVFKKALKEWSRPEIGLHN